MTSRTVWTCDRCKKDGVTSVYHVDLGNDYTTPREVDEPHKKRIHRDLCGDCYGALRTWMDSSSIPEGF